jgi:hypothetical protein
MFHIYPAEVRTADILNLKQDCQPLHCGEMRWLFAALQNQLHFTPKNPSLEFPSCSASKEIPALDEKSIFITVKGIIFLDVMLSSLVGIRRNSFMVEE